MYSAALFLCSSIFLAQASIPHGLRPEEHSRRGIELARQGELAEAERQLRTAVAGAPVNATYRAQLGSVLGLEGKWTEALRNFQKAVDLAPSNIDFRRETAAVQWQLGLMPSAERNLQYVLEKHPGDPGSILLLGLVKERTGEYGKAAELLDSQFAQVRAQPDRVVAMFHSVTQSGQPDRVPKLVEVLKLHASDPQWANAISRCTQMAVASGDLETAEDIFALLSVDNRERAVAGVQLAKLLYNRGQIPQAKAFVSHRTGHGEH